MIAYFVYNLENYSGAAQQALLLAKNIKLKILIFNHCNKTYRRYLENNLVEIVDLPKSKLLQLMIIAYHTIKNNIKIYHFHGFFVFGFVLGILLNRKIIQKTTLLGDDDFDTLKTKKNWKIRLFLLGRISKNIVLSEKLKEINSKYIDSSKIIKIPNGVQLADACPQLKEKENSFCFVGLVCKRKRTYESIKYFIDNYSHINDTKMLVIGPYKDMPNYQDFSNEYVDKCRELIESHGLEDRIILTGKLSKSKTQEMLRKSKALLFFSDKEGMPNVVLESLANNCVPIVSEMDGVAREIFENGVHGFIVDRSSGNIAMSKIEEMIERQTPFKLIKSKLDICLIAGIYKRIYDSE